MQRAGPGSHHLGPEDIAAVQATGGGLHITAHLHVGPRRDPFRGEGSSAAYRVSYVSPGDTQMDRPEEASTSLPTCTSVQGISAQQVRREGAGVPTSTAGKAGYLRPDCDHIMTVKGGSQVAADRGGLPSNSADVHPLPRSSITHASWDVA